MYRQTIQTNGSLHTISVFRNAPLGLFCVQQHTVARLAQIYLHHLLLSYKYRLLAAILGKGFRNANVVF